MKNPTTVAGRLEQYRTYLAIDQLDLDRCLMEQPEMYYHVSVSFAQATAARDAEKLSVEELQAQLDQDIRSEAARRDEKLTEAALQNRLRTLPKVQDAQRVLLDKRREADEWQALKEAFQQRSFMLRELVALYIAQRHDAAMEGGAGQARTSLAESNRAAATAARQERKRI